jgi:hypothetical protein
MSTPDYTQQNGDDSEPVNAEALDAAEQDIKPPSDPAEQPPLEGYTS